MAITSFTIYNFGMGKLVLSSGKLPPQKGEWIVPPVDMRYEEVNLDSLRQSKGRRSEERMIILEGWRESIDVTFERLPLDD